MTDYQGVIGEWKQRAKDLAAVHPSGNESAEAFFQSGWEQIEDVTDIAAEGARVLDFGCGPGRLTIPLAKIGYEVYAADASQEMLDEVQAHAKAEGVNVKTFQSDATDLAKHFGRKKADAIVCRAVIIHHDYDGGATVVKGLAGVLKKGGHLIIDWPTGEPHVRRDWIDVTVWDQAHRDKVAAEAGLVPVRDTEQPTVWRKA